MNRQLKTPTPFPALLVFNLILYGIAGYYLTTGLPPVVMVLIGLASGLLVTGLLYLLFQLLGKMVVRLPLQVNTAVLAALVSLLILKYSAFRWPDALFRPLIFLGIGLAVLLYYAVRKLRQDHRAIWAWSAIALSVVLVLAGLNWLEKEGSDPFAKDLPPAWEGVQLATLSERGLSSPAEDGTFSIQQFTYGSGTDEKRIEFASGVQYSTPTVDASKLLPEWKGSKKKWRERYWGFGVENFPLNGRVHMPDGEGPFPLILIVHGNHSMIDYSDGGYAYLGELLASRGFITVSVDENFINGHWSGDFRGKEMPTRAWLLLKHLEQWRNWNDDPNHNLAGKADLENVLLIGHSRGGEAVSIAAAFNRLTHFPDNALVRFDFNFGIKGVVALAPTDYRYQREISLENINFLSLQGSYDADEVSFWGMRAYRRLQFTDGAPWFKAGVYLHRANHGQFNSSWGRTDFGGTFQWLLNRGALISGEDQRTAAKVFISAFAEAALQDSLAYLPLFENAALARDWLPENYYLTHFTDTNSQTIVDFEDDIDLTTGGHGVSIRTENLKVWREEELTTRDGGSQNNHAVMIGWDYSNEIPEDSLAVFEITLPDSMAFTLDTTGQFHIVLAAADHKELDKTITDKSKKREAPALDLRIVLVDHQGHEASISVSDIKDLKPRLKTRFTKLKSLDQDIVGAEWEVQLETFHLAFASFKKQEEAFSLQSLRSILLVFDQVTYGLIVIDDIGVDVQKPRAVVDF